MIDGATGQAFWLGKYDPKHEKFHITSDELHWIDIGGGGGPFSGGAAHWAATSNSFANRPRGTDNRLLWVAWVSSAGRGNLNTLSLVRELRWDRVASRLVSYPVIEYEQLRNATLLPPQSTIGELAPGAVKTLPIPEGTGGALDLEVSFDLSKLEAGATATKFGVAARAPAAGVAGAAQDVWFEVGVADAAGVRNVTVGGIMNGQPLRCGTIGSNSHCIWYSNSWQFLHIATVRFRGWRNRIRAVGMSARATSRRFTRASLLL